MDGHFAQTGRHAPTNNITTSKYMMFINPEAYITETETCRKTRAKKQILGSSYDVVFRQVMTEN